MPERVGVYMQPADIVCESSVCVFQRVRERTQFSVFLFLQTFVCVVEFALIIGGCLRSCQCAGLSGPSA